MKKSARRKLLNLESRIWNYGLKSMDQLRSLMMGYFQEDKIVEKYFNINTTKASKDFTDMTTLHKNAYMRPFEAAVTTDGRDIYARAIKRWTVSRPIWNNQTFIHRENWVPICSKILS